MTLYEVLGLSDKATIQEIKVAHRDAVKRHHPDAGGDPQKFNEAQRAYFILSDVDRRARYDTTGVQDDEPASTEDQLAQSAIANLIMQFIDSSDDLSKTDVVAAVRSTLRAQRKGHETVCQNLRVKINRLDTLRRRLHRSDTSGMFDALMVERENALNASLVNEQKRLRTLDRALTILSEYQYSTVQDGADERAIWSALKSGGATADR